MADETILIIDANRERVETIATHLQCEGFKIAHTSCVVMGISEISKVSPAIVLISSKLQLLHSRDFLYLKQLVGEYADIPAIIYAATKSEMYEYLRDGGDDVLIDPLDLAELTLRLKVTLRRKMRKGVEGTFAHIPLLDFVQMVVASRLSGRFDLDVYAYRGSLFFQRGQLLRACSEEYEGEEAFGYLICAGRKGGNFIFTALNNAEIVRNINKPTEHLLLEIANSLDEGGGG